MLKSHNGNYTVPTQQQLPNISQKSMLKYKIKCPEPDNSSIWHTTNTANESDRDVVSMGIG